MISLTILTGLQQLYLQLILNQQLDVIIAKLTQAIQPTNNQKHSWFVKNKARKGVKKTRASFL